MNDQTQAWQDIAHWDRVVRHGSQARYRQKHLGAEQDLVCSLILKYQDLNIEIGHETCDIGIQINTLAPDLRKEP